MTWLQRLFAAQNRHRDISDDEIDALRAGLGTHIRILETQIVPMDQSAQLAAEASLLQIELTCRLLDEIRGLREDMAAYRNRER